MDKQKDPGFFKFDRLVRDRLARELDPTSRLLLQDLMILARWKRGKCKVRIPGEAAKRYLLAGEWITSSVKLSVMTGLCEKTIRRKLALLQRVLPWFGYRLSRGGRKRGSLWYSACREAASEWCGNRTESPVVDGNRTESPLATRQPDRESGRESGNRTESPVEALATGQRVRSRNPINDTGATQSPEKSRIRDRLRRNTGQLSASPPDTGPVWRSLSVLENPTLSEPARRAVGDIMKRWPNSNGFRNVAALNDALEYRLDREPTRCVAQVFDVGQAKAPKDILALLLSRLKKGWKKEPSDSKAWPFARSVMNSGRQGKGGSASLGAILQNFLHTKKGDG